MNLKLKEKDQNFEKNNKKGLVGWLVWRVICIVDM